jgi:hypothetical protein
MQPDRRAGAAAAYAPQAARGPEAGGERGRGRDESAFTRFRK